MDTFWGGGGCQGRGRVQRYAICDWRHHLFQSPLQSKVSKETSLIVCIFETPPPPPHPSIHWWWKTETKSHSRNHLITGKSNHNTCLYESSGYVLQKQNRRSSIISWMASLWKNSTSGKLKIFNEMKILKRDKKKQITSVKKLREIYGMVYSRNCSVLGKISPKKCS